MVLFQVDHTRIVAYKVLDWSVSNVYQLLAMTMPLVQTMYEKCPAYYRFDRWNLQFHYPDMIKWIVPADPNLSNVVFPWWLTKKVPTKNNRHLAIFLDAHLNHHSVADVHRATNIISLYQCDAIAELRTENQRSSK